MVIVLCRLELYAMSLLKVRKEGGCEERERRARLRRTGTQRYAVQHSNSNMTIASRGMRKQEAIRRTEPGSAALKRAGLRVHASAADDNDGDVEAGDDDVVPGPYRELPFHA